MIGGALLALNIVITGSTRGVGFAMAREFLRSGHNVMVSGRRPESLTDSELRLAEYSGQTAFTLCDVGSRQDVERLWAETVARWGSVDIWVNNAGANQPLLPAWEVDERCTRRVLDANITGMIFGSQVAAAGMLRQGKGAIYNMEGMGSNNMHAKGATLYGTTKRALTYFTRGLAKELAGTPVIAGRLSPGMMLTDFLLLPVEGEERPVLENAAFVRILNILADRPETVARFLVHEMLTNTRNDAHIVWLTGTKAALRFISAPFTRRNVLENRREE